MLNITDGFAWANIRIHRKGNEMGTKARGAPQSHGRRVAGAAPESFSIRSVMAVTMRSRGECLISSMHEKYPDRQSIRLRGYDYSASGAYFITLCTQNRERLFGKIVRGEMHLNAAGRIAQHGWEQIRVHFPHVELDAFVIMPDHVHGIVWINDVAIPGDSGE